MLAQESEYINWWEIDLHWNFYIRREGKKSSMMKQYFYGRAKWCSTIKSTILSYSRDHLAVSVPLILNFSVPFESKNRIITTCRQKFHYHRAWLFVALYIMPPQFWIDCSLLVLIKQELAWKLQSCITCFCNPCGATWTAATGRWANGPAIDLPSFLPDSFIINVYSNINSMLLLEPALMLRHYSLCKVIFEMPCCPLEGT